MVSPWTAVRWFTQHCRYRRLTSSRSEAAWLTVTVCILWFVCKCSIPLYLEWPLSTPLSSIAYSSLPFAAAAASRLCQQYDSQCVDEDHSGRPLPNDGHSDGSSPLSPPNRPTHPFTVLLADTAVPAPAAPAAVEEDITMPTGQLFRHLLAAANSSHHRLLHFSDRQRRRQLAAARAMFRRGYAGYMRYAFPLDELDPVHCRGRGPDRARPANLNINDVLGGYSLTLVDSLDTLVVMGEARLFRQALRLVLQHVHFDLNSTVQVFEANIRLLGALLSTHLLLIDERQPWGRQLRPPHYTDQLLLLARDLGSRLLAAFTVSGSGSSAANTSSSTGIPLPRVNLRSGAPVPSPLHPSDTCTAGAGSLLLELGTLARLSAEPVFETVARRAVDALWRRRSSATGLLGVTVDAASGRWTGSMAGLGAGLDSFYEYLLKAYIVLGDARDYSRFRQLYAGVKRHMRRGRDSCNTAAATLSAGTSGGGGADHHPLYVNVDMNSGRTANGWVDSLQAAFPAVQLLAGDVEEAICHHALFYAIWKRYGALPERYSWQHKTAELLFYPLRPELAESTYFLYRATKNPFYLHVGRDMLVSIERHARAPCGYTTLHSVVDKSQEDRMESFFLSETCKYLYLLFDEHNWVNQHEEDYVFSTEGHLFPVRLPLSGQQQQASSAGQRGSRATCDAIPPVRRYAQPLEPFHFYQLLNEIGAPH